MYQQADDVSCHPRESVVDLVVQTYFADSQRIEQQQCDEVRDGLSQRREELGWLSHQVGSAVQGTIWADIS